MSSEYREPARVFVDPPLRRDLVFGVVELGIDIDGVGRAAAPLIGVNQTDLICLSILYWRGAMTAGQLASTVGLTTGAMTTVIDRLERGGYVARRADATDRRRVLVEAVPEAALRAFGLFDELLERLADLADGYSEEQLATFVEMFGRIQRTLAEFAATLRARAADARTAGPGA